MEDKQKYYKITQDEAIIPDDADIVELDIKIDYDPEAYSQMIRVFLPQNPKPLHSYKIYNSRSIIGEERRSVYIFRNNKASYNMYYIYEMQCVEMLYNPVRNSWSYTYYQASNDEQEWE